MSIENSIFIVLPCYLKSTPLYIYHISSLGIGLVMQRLSIICVLLFFCNSTHGENTIFAKTKECNGILKKAGKFVGKEQWIKAREALGDLEVSGEICQNDYQRALYWHNAVYILDKLSDTSGVILAYKKLADTPDVSKDLKTTAHRNLAYQYAKLDKYQSAAEQYEILITEIDDIPITDLERISWLYTNTQNYKRGLEVSTLLFNKLEHSGIQPKKEHYTWKIWFQIQLSDWSNQRLTLGEAIEDYPANDTWKSMLKLLDEIAQ